MIRQFANTFSRWTCAAGLLALLAAGTVVGAPRSRGRTALGIRQRPGAHIRNGQWHGVHPAFSGNYYIDRRFSAGPMMQISPTGDLFHISFAGVGRYHFRLNNGINLVPFMEIGLIHADLDRGTGPGRIDRSDTSWYIPIGVSLEYQASHNLALTSTLIVNLHDINLSPSLSKNDTTSVALLFGFRFALSRMLKKSASFPEG